MASKFFFEEQREEFAYKDQKLKQLKIVTFRQQVICKLIINIFQK